MVSHFTLRTENAYNNNLAAIKWHPESSTLHGLKERSVLNELYYYVAKGLPPDLAHDLFDGFVVDVVSNVIISFIQQGSFQLDELNNIITNFH